MEIHHSLGPLEGQFLAKSEFFRGHHGHIGQVQGTVVSYSGLLLVDLGLLLQVSTDLVNIEIFLEP